MVHLQLESTEQGKEQGDVLKSLTNAGCQDYKKVRVRFEEQGDVLKSLTNSTCHNYKKVRMLGDRLFAPFRSHRYAGTRDAEAAGNIDAAMAAGKSDMADEASGVRYVLRAGLRRQFLP